MQWALEPFQGQYDYCLIDCMNNIRACADEIVLNDIVYS